MSFRIKDKVWVQQAFLLPEGALDNTDRRRRVLTSAAYKFTDTTLGGNFSINAPPQFTRFADIRVGGSEAYADGNGGRVSGSSTPGGVRWMNSTGKFQASTETGISRFTSPSAGMGRYYSEAIDDWGQDLVLRFGVPEFNSLTQFFGNFYDSNLATFARTGRTTSMFTIAGRVAGFLVALPLQPLILGGQFIRFMGNWPSSKYYYLKPAMYPYWTAVNTIANAIAVNIGLTPQAMTPMQVGLSGEDGSQIAADQKETMEEYAKHVPDIFLKSNGEYAGIDVFKVANRAQRLANKFNTELYTKLDETMGNPTDPNSTAARLFAAINEVRSKMASGGINDEPSDIDGYRAYYLENERNQDNVESSYIRLDGTAALTADADLNAAGDAPGDAPTDVTSETKGVEGANPDGTRPWYNSGFIGELRNMYEGERRDGAQFVSFRVGYSGSSSEDFSSSTEESQVSQKFNSMSSSARSSRFDLANGNIAGDGLIGGLIGSVATAAKNVMTGALDGLQMSGLMALAGNAFVDIPKTWSGSSANLPKASYSIQLRSPYGDRMSLFMNIYVPLAMLLAAALPLSTGKRSYTSPFICEAYCRGRHAIRLGIFESLSVSRGEGNLGWSQDGQALGVDVNFTIADLSSIMHLPIQANFGFTDAFTQGVSDMIGGEAGMNVASYFQKGTYDDDNTFNDYMAVLGGLSWQDLVYANRRWRLSRYRQMQNWRSWKSPARVSMFLGNTYPGRLVNALSVETDRPD